MKRLLLFIAAASMAVSAQAQEADPDDLIVILPEDAQECVLPAAPDAIPENADLEQLKVAKAQVGEFQAKVTEFRTCLGNAEKNEDNTTGNKAAIVDSYNYSVEMEERVAARFNEAVRDYKERKAAAEG
ncbi:MAG: hypothetical protein HKO85_02760 [Xanthomonadales bacterium]|nr:hypothetical protein [Gammaproteobacteria bacterium]MBT8056599.1 hypothetical protein [Gammaproteobacteria bacterium]NNL04181.1 hypothetical protein [Xanthomonadales bacterium]